MNLEFDIFINYGPMLLLGFWLTLKIVTCAIILGVPLGLFLALGRRSKFIIISFLYMRLGFRNYFLTTVF